MSWSVAAAGVKGIEARPLRGTRKVIDQVLASVCCYPIVQIRPIISAIGGVVCCPTEVLLVVPTANCLVIDCWS